MNPNHTGQSDIPATNADAQAPGAPCTDRRSGQWVPLGAASPLEPAVRAWLDNGTPLIWRPMFDEEDFPEAETAELQQARTSCGPCWVIKHAADLMCLPQGVKGWLMPVDAEDTPIACGRWENRVTFMTVQDGRDGAAVTFKSLTAGSPPAE